MEGTGNHFIPTTEQLPIALQESNLLKWLGIASAQFPLFADNCGGF